jgi:hypothetical protein
MIHYKPYPIYINYSTLKAHALRTMDEFQRKGDLHMMKFMRKMANEDLEILPSNPPTRESTAYEQAVCRQIRIIESTVIGRLLLGLLSKNVKIWIVPIDEDFAGVYCKCMAATTPGVLDARQGGGVRVRYNVEDYEFKDFFITPDAALFHELVHAYRSARVGFSGLSWKKMDEYKTEEEFLAVQLHNVYIACRGGQRFNRSHDYISVQLSKDAAYKHIAADWQALAALRHYLEHEPLTRQVANLGPLGFNPWRDYTQLQAEWDRAHPYDPATKIRGLIQPAP